MKRLIPVDVNAAKELKNLLKEAKNNAERKRINIMAVYLWWQWIEAVSKILHVSMWTVSLLANKYKECRKDFFRTKYVWRKRTPEREKIKEEIEELIKQAKEKDENLDIMDIRDMINKKHKEEVLTYHQAWEFTRKVLNLNYQKPYVRNHKQAENAKEILQERLTEAIVKVGEERKIIDAWAIKNKKTKIWRNNS